MVRIVSQHWRGWPGLTGLARVTATMGVAALTTAALTGAGAPVRANGPGRPAVSGSAWGKAEEVPGMAKLNKGPLASVDTVSCAAPGYCTAAGDYGDQAGGQAFAVTETKGTWGSAEELPGTAALNKDGDAGVLWVSCASPGNCGAGGQYATSRSRDEAFVASQANGRWGTAREVPGTAALDAGHDASVTTVSCPSVGNCSASGYYASSHLHWQAFVADETGGTWGSAEEVPGTAALNRGSDAQLLQVSCASTGNCGAGGYYTDSSGRQQVFVVSEAKGRWGTAEKLPGTAAPAPGSVTITSISVSCTSPGDCGAGGYYIGAGRREQAFLASEVNGGWETAQKVRGLAAGANPEVDAVSCASAGNCAAGGHYTGRNGDWQAFVVAQTQGRWGAAEPVPGTARLNQGSGASVFGLSCAAPGDCAAVGDYADGAGDPQAWIAGEVAGTWGTAENIPGLAALDKPAGDPDFARAVSCATPGHCSAGGYYSDIPHVYNDPFVVSEP